MFLKALEIQGFKSFPDKTVLTFGEDITAIVGPNGSGKSNLSDAVRWVMGEQSSRALRGGKMEDVIFGGTEKRRQLGFAEVSLVLEDPDHQLGQPEDEVRVTRRYYRSGESEYYINRHTVRLKDVNELFMDTGLGREGYSIIGQGRIDEILSVKSADRREVFEEAAGISRFRHRKEEAERRLERTEENLVRIRDKIDELELQVEPLRQQAEKAKKFLLCRDEMRGLEISLWLEQLDRLRTEALRTTSEHERAVRRKEEAARAQEDLYAKAEALGARMREKDVEAEGIRFTMMQRQADANGLESAVAVLRSSIRHNTDNAGRIRRELEQQEGREGSLDEQIRSRKDRLAAIAAETADIRTALTEQEQEAVRLSGQAGELDGQLQELRRKAELDTASAAEAKALLSALAAAAQELLDRDEAIRRSIAEEEESIRALETEAAGAQAELDKAREGRDALRNIIQGYGLRVRTRSDKADKAEQLRRDLEVEDRSLTARIRMLRELEKSYEGFQKAVKLVMGEAGRDRLRGIRGPVASLIRVPDPWAVAIETALGGAMQHLVVERQEDGKAAIQWLKRRDGGRATFLPMDAVRPSDFRDKAVAQEPGFVGMGDALVSFEAEYGRIFSNLLGRTVVAEDMDAAIAMARKYGHRFKIVTLDGQVLNPGGSMTGGSASRSAGILSRANELERLDRQAAGLSQKLEEASHAAAEAAREAAKARYELETAQGQVRQHEDAILQLEERRARQEERLRELRTRRDEQREELSQLSQRQEQTENDTGKARARIEALEGSAAALRAEAQGKEAGQQSFREKMELLQTALHEGKARLAALSAEKETTADSLEELEALRQDLAGDRLQQTALLAEFDEKNAGLEREIREKEDRLCAIRAEAKDREEDIARLNREKLDLEAQRNQADKDSREQNAVLLELERSAAALEQKKQTQAMEEKNLLDKLWETYELTHQAALRQRVALESVSQAQRRVAELKRTISGLGNINLDAIEEFQRVNERYTYLTDQRDDVEKAKKELGGIIAAITDEMKRIFGEEFAKLNEVFQSTFKELFGGGHASLELEDEDDILNCGIEIRVQPPGKALKILTLLSGGEKAFVAIALYFAILKVRPTPFCVMDEIEAALDDANVSRYAHYLRRMADKTQFIVITHRRGTMEEADVLYGVTMQERGVSRVLTIDLNRAERELGLKAD
ncbi:chromosome segregation protein SMC [Pseudoflavonifractor sp. MSJ-37]|uniref:chromosome segregation protein SMC n=1 Tax=Pseudoflavonifractor sp. MSJ-37 TaxID=2841531 RepID=UPI001C111F61|nr:chromosome segregation protein SMC [Pseudoflavonifractor sp. MSJ-37]MBU5434179.1 chromosome segregation protein SMC [Pseudoflavonifractor sp. MSJ-37]